MSIQDRKEKEKEFKQTIILDAAKVIFERDGYNQSKIDDIAKEAGFAKGSVYNYFKSKKEIMEAVVIEIVIKKNEDLFSIMQHDNLDPEEKIRKVISLHYDTVVNPSTSIVMNYFKDVNAFLLFLHEAIPSLKKIEMKIIAVIAQLIKDFHEVHPIECECDFDPYTLARLFNSYGRGVMMEVMTSRLFCDESDIEKVEEDNKKLIDKHIEFLLYSLENVHIND